MNPNKKVLFTFLSFVLTMLVIACSCSSLIPTTAPAQSSSQEPATATAQSSDQESIPGLAGIWQDPLTLDTFEIDYRGNGQYMVLSAVWVGPVYGASFDITSRSWTGSSLTWTYYNYNDKVSITYETTSLSGDSLYTNWSNDQGSFGPHTLVRLTTYPG